MTHCTCRIEHQKSGYGGDIESIAQCPLCKAAPDLLEACEKTLIDWVGTCQEYDVPNEDMEAVKEVLKQAIAKATGDLNDTTR